MLSNTCAVSLFVLDPFQIMIRKEDCFTWNNLCLSYWAAKSILQSQSECKKNFEVESLKDVVLVANRWGRLSDAECKAKLEKLHCPGSFLTGAVEKKAHLAHNIEHTVDSVPLLVHEEIDSRRITLTAWAWVFTLNKTYLRTAYYFTSLYSPILWPDPLDGHWNEYQNQYYLSKFNKLLSKSEFLRPFVGIQNHDIAL